MEKSWNHISSWEKVPDSLCLIRVKSDSPVHIIEAVWWESTLPCIELCFSLDGRHMIDCLQNLVSHTGLYSDNNQYNEGLRKKKTDMREVWKLLFCLEKIIGK